MSDTMPIKLVKIAEDDDGENQWIVTFDYRASGRTWFTANIAVPKIIDEERIVPYARNVLHDICRIARDATADWRIDKEKLKGWESGEEV